MTLFFNGVSCSSKLYLFQKYRKKQWYCEILLQFLILVSYFNTYTLKYNLFLWSKAEFSSSLLQSSVSHDPSEIILKCWIIISVADLPQWNCCAA